MAASFGLWELKLPSSRAVYDDEDEEDIQATDLVELLGSPTFHWLPPLMKYGNGNLTEKLQCSLLVFGVGEVATSFLKAHFLFAGSEAVGLMTEEKKNGSVEDLGVEENMNKCFLFYRLKANQDTVICQTNMNLPSEKSFNWTCKMFEEINPSKVLLITSSPACEYHSQTPDKLPSDFVKMLKTDSWSAKGYSVDCDSLETPNMIKDVPAAVLSHCQVHDIPAAVFVCYTESYHLDSRSVEAFRFLLSSSHLVRLQQSTDEEVARYLKSVATGKLAENNIYI